VNAVDNDGNTPLHIYCSKADHAHELYGFFGLLLGDGEVKSIPRKGGYLPLHL
jgi:hypothetical protein